METLLQDVRVSLRGFRQNPAFAAIAVACMALGVGASSSIFSVVEGVLLRPFPFADPDRIVALHRSRVADPSVDSFAYLDFFDLEHQAAPSNTAAVGAYRTQNLTLDGAQPELLTGEAISAGLFPMLGVAPARGRGFRAEDDRPGAPGAILLGDGLWHRTFHADPGVVGRTIQVDGAACTVVGVMPPAFAFPARAEAWVPLAPRSYLESRTNRDLAVLARRRPGASAATLQSEMDAFARRQAVAFPRADAGWEIHQRSLRDEVLIPGTRLVLGALFGAVVFVLLIACANVASLQLARATDRRREMAVRFAFGAGAGRILRFLLTESLLLSLAGGVLGLLLALAGIPLIVATIPAAHRAYWLRFDLDGTVLLFTLLVAVGTGLAFGLAPAASALGRSLDGLLKEGGRTSGASRDTNRLRGTLVVAEIALALVLLVGASLTTRAFLRLSASNLGFDPAHLLTLRVFLAGSAYDQEPPRQRRVDDLVRRIAALPGVDHAGAANLVPIAGGGQGAEIAVEGRPVATGNEPSGRYTGVTADYLATLGAPLLAGRTLTAHEAATLTPVAVVNHAFADHFWPGETPLGRRFRLADTDHREWLTVVGEVADFRGDEMLGNPMQRTAYLPFPYQSWRGNGIVVRSRLPPAALIALIRRQVHAADPGLALYQVATMTHLRDEASWPLRLFGSVFAAFGAIALLLAAIGIYGVLSYTVSQRLREIGVRIALGAQHRHILRLVLGHALALTLAGLACGAVAARGLAPVIAEVLYQVDPTDPALFATLSFILGGVALLASLLPALRALRADPLDSLRQE